MGAYLRPHHMFPKTPTHPPKWAPSKGKPP